MPVRSLADDLRGRSDDQLERLLTGRPDLLHPVPADMTALAARSSNRLAALGECSREPGFRGDGAEKLCDGADIVATVMESCSRMCKTGRRDECL